ncbi:MAG: hypothetical protein GC164_16685 [Phycisphaera sp.]|nr:hypothetical protein [Phycisphaera sp.]
MSIRTASLSLLVVLLALTVGTGVARATTFTFTPTPADLYDLDHYYYYKWGVNFSVPNGEVICDAKIQFKNIANWDNNPNVLYAHLFDYASLGVKQYYDGQGGGDAFAGVGVKLFEWVNLTTTPSTRTYTFDQTALDALATYALDGRIGFGFDPDCHYWNDGITLTIETCSPPPPPSTAVPEPVTASLSLMGLSALTLTALRRRRA